VAGAEFAAFVGVTLKTIEVALTDVIEDVNDVPSTAFVIETFAPVAKPEPVMVTGVAEAASHTDEGLIPPPEITGAASRTAAEGNDAVGPFASVRIAEHVDAAVPVAVKLAVPVVAEVSATVLKVKVLAPVHVATKVSFVAPLSANPVPVKVTVPVEPPALRPVEFEVAPAGVNAIAVKDPAAALAAVAIANGSAAAASKAPEASALTKWRCIRRGLFMVNSLHS
jgi:hypothetical protein